MGRINIQNVSIQNIKCRKQGQTVKVWGEGCKAALRSKLIYVINVNPNLWQYTAHWISWIYLSYI